MSDTSRIQKVEPLKSAEWQFPLGCATARLSIVADQGCEIRSDDMKTLADYAALFERQLGRQTAGNAGAKPDWEQEAINRVDLGPDA